MARLPRTPAEKRARLLQRIAAVRAGALDSAPDVQSALMAVEELRPQDMPQTVTDSSALEAQLSVPGAGKSGGGDALAGRKAMEAAHEASVRL